MAISASLATARRTTLATCLCAALATSTTGWRPADASMDAHTGTRAAHHVSANVIPVTSCADDGTDGTLRNAIAGAGDGDTIDMSALDCAVISLQSGSLVSPVPNLTLKGPGRDALTIDGNNADRVLEGTYLDVSDLTIAHGLVISGAAGCVLAQGDLSLTRARITECVAVSSTVGAGGGAALVFGNLLMRDAEISSSKAIGADIAMGGGVIAGGAAMLYTSTITGNSALASQAGAYAGGLYAIGALEMHASLIGGNLAHSTYGAAYGGGLHSTADISIFDGSAVTDNTAASDTSWSYGGGINSGLSAIANSATVTIDASTISRNAAKSHCGNCFVSGGGVHSFDSITAAYSTVDNNDATCEDTATACAAGGGGLWAYGTGGVASQVNLRNCTISTNTATGGTQAGGFGVGGGLAVGFDAQIIAHNTTIAFNHASLLAGGVAVGANAAVASELVSAIVANNDTDSGPNDVDSLFNGGTFSGAKNVVMTSAGGVVLPADTSSVDPMLQPLAANGGRTATHALAAASAAIDAGANPDNLGCDQRGFPHRRTYGTSADIGAYEFDGEPHIFADNFDGAIACPPAP